MSSISPLFFSPPHTRRRLRQIATGTAALLLPCHFAHAISAGASPDSPNIRVDANLPTSAFAGVGFVDAIGSGGTGTAIDSTHILTAGHVIANGSYSATNPIKFYLNNGPTPTIITATATIDPDFHGVNGNDSHDLAILTLSSPLPVGTPTYSLYTAALTAGQTLTFIGYGISGDGVNGYQPNTYPQTNNIKRVGGNSADLAAVANGSGFSGAALAAGAQTYLFDFDGPNASTNIIGGGTLGNGIETTIGQGDSGSPAFIFVNGRYQIAAVNNFAFDLNNPTDNTHPAVGFFGSGGGGPVVSGYLGAGGFLTPYAAPEPDILCAYTLGSLLLMGGFWRAQRRVRRIL